MGGGAAKRLGVREASTRRQRVSATLAGASSVAISSSTRAPAAVEASQELVERLRLASASEELQTAQCGPGPRIRRGGRPGGGGRGDGAAGPALAPSGPTWCAACGPKIFTAGIASKRKLGEVDHAVREHLSAPDTLVPPHLLVLTWAANQAARIPLATTPGGGRCCAGTGPRVPGLAG